MIYTITAMSCGRIQRNIGYFFDKVDAFAKVKANSLDMHEGDNTYAIVEEVSEGLYGSLDENCETWFKWVEGRYIEIPKPKKFRGIVNWAIG